MKNNNTSNHFTAEQGILPMFPSEILNVDDPVLMYDRFMEEIDLKKYLRYIPTRGAGRPRYNPVNMLKTIIYGFAEEGYCSFRKLEDNCRVNIRYMYLMNYEAPSYRTFCHFVKGFLKYSLKDIFYSITKELCGKLNVDLQHIYILTVPSFKRTQINTAGYGRNPLKNPDTSFLPRLPAFLSYSMMILSMTI